MSTRRTCPACARAYIKGKRAFFASRTGGRWATVCLRCADAGMTIVQDRTGDFAKCVHCDVEPAVFCSACAMRGAAKLHGSGA